MSLSDKIAIAGIIISLSGFTIKGTIIYVKTNTHKMREVFKNPYIDTFFVVFLLSLLSAVIPWHKFHYGDISTAQKIVIVHDTPIISKSKSDIKFKSPIIAKPLTKITNRILQPKTKVIYAPKKSNIHLNSKAVDTTKIGTYSFNNSNP